MIDFSTHTIILVVMFLVTIALNPTRPDPRRPTNSKPGSGTHSGQPNASAIRKAREAVYRARLEFEGNDGCAGEGADLQAARHHLRELERNGD